MDSQEEISKQKVIDQVTPVLSPPINQPVGATLAPDHQPPVSKTTAKNSVGLVISVAVVVIIGLIVLALLAYKKSSGQ